MENKQKNKEFLVFTGDFLETLYVFGIFEEYSFLQRFANLCRIYLDQCKQNSLPPEDLQNIKTDFNKEKHANACTKIIKFKKLKQKERDYILLIVSELKIRFPKGTLNRHHNMHVFIRSFLLGVINDNKTRITRIEKNYYRLITHPRVR